MRAKTVYTCGDPHGSINKVNELINKTHPDVLIVNGDFALHWYEEMSIRGNETKWILSDRSLNDLKPQNTKIFWLMGNHQAWDWMEMAYGRYGVAPIEMKKNVFYCPIGSTLTINDKNCLFIGGACSTDIDMREPNKTWFAQEQLMETDFDFIRDTVKESLHCIFSHTCPQEFEIQEKYDCLSRIYDPSRRVLSKAFDLYKPKYWFFGHWHRQKGGIYKETIWQGLNTLSPGYSDEGKAIVDISAIFN